MENFGENQSFENVENIRTQESQTQPISTQGEEFLVMIFLKFIFKKFVVVIKHLK